MTRHSCSPESPATIAQIEATLAVQKRYGDLLKGETQFYPKSCSEEFTRRGILRGEVVLPPTLFEELDRCVVRFCQAKGIDPAPVLLQIRVDMREVATVGDLDDAADEALKTASRLSVTVEDSRTDGVISPSEAREIRKHALVLMTQGRNLAANVAARFGYSHATASHTAASVMGARVQ